MSRKNFDGQAVVVTAAANGIGRATALEFAREGAILSLIDVETRELEDTATKARALGAEVKTWVLDCRSEDQVREAFSGIGAVDVLVNGIGTSARERTSDFRASVSDVWQFVHEVTLRTTMLCSRQAVPGMCDRAGERSSTFRATRP